MYYAGIDYHKKYSFVSIQDELGKVVLEGQIAHNDPYVFRDVFRQMDGPVAVVYEAGLNWSWLYEELEGMENVDSITLANAYKVRLIAEAQIKTDKIDACPARCGGAFSGVFEGDVSCDSMLGRVRDDVGNVVLSVFLPLKIDLD